MTVNFNLDGCKVHFCSGRIAYNRVRQDWHALAETAAEKFCAAYAALDKRRTDLLLCVYQQGCLQLQYALQAAETGLKRDSRATAELPQLINRWREDYFDWDGHVEQISRGELATRAADPEQETRPEMLTRGGHPHFALRDFEQTALTCAGFVSKIRLFSDPETEQYLARGIYRNAFSIHLALIDLWQQSGIKSIRAVTAEDEAEARALHAAIQAGEIASHGLAAACGQLLMLNPYDRAYYLNYLKAIGDQQNELERMAAFCGIDGIREQKRFLIASYTESLLLQKKESDLITGLRQLVTKCALLGVNPVNQHVAAVENRIASLALPTTPLA